MDQTKLIGQLASASSGDTEDRIPAAIGANEIRTLGDLELLIAGGGDGVVIW